MAKSIKSHAFFVGNLPQISGIDSIKAVFGEPVKEDRKTYENILCSLFHKSHIDAMIEAEGQTRPKVLDSVHHFRLEINKELPFSVFNSYNSQLKVLDGYRFVLKSLHLYLFPVGITLYALEVDDSGSDMDELTYAHFVLRELPSRWSQFPAELTDILQPILDLTGCDNTKELVSLGNKLKLFQTIQTAPDFYSREHLFEVAMCLPIDTVGTTHAMAPSQEYFDSIIEENLIAPFNNWMALAIMDSFTVLFTDAYDERTWFDSYYRLIYLRVLMQKTFLSNRNKQYRLDKVDKNLTRDLAIMDRFYFYDTISFNFLPDIINKQMSKGLGIKEEQEELSVQIKESEAKAKDVMVGVVSAFAIFSVAYDSYSLFHEAETSTAPLIMSIVAIVAVILIVFRLLRK